ncbi:9608_t:CDS:2 [Ambispora leptoticha]|uniref:9608_t:CDS:1 n=1 Tax=Ambispora leptoticha TaxID=144679 RepID=A0A9N8VMW8_9GLOM|nr:9608_t:CDS:2 [Ambispora leptoticha]
MLEHILYRESLQNQHQVQQQLPLQQPLQQQQNSNIMNPFINGTIDIFNNQSNALYNTPR